MTCRQKEMPTENNAMRTPTMIAGIIIVATAMLLLGAWPAFSEGPPAKEDVDLAAILPQTITYQGRLTDNQGDPIDGHYTMRFFLYNVATGGIPLSDSGDQTVSVAEGLFTIPLSIHPSRFDGQALWLEIHVQGQVLSPRQPITAAPYAMSLRPGGLIKLQATGMAVRVESTQGVGLEGTGRVTGVYGVSSSPTQGAGFGVHGESSTGIGVYGRSTAHSSLNNLYAPGVSGYSQHGVGVLGQAATGFAIIGDSPGVGVGGIGRVYGVYGASASPSQGAGYGGYFASSTGAGVHGRSTAQSSSNNLYAPGVWGYSQRGAAIYGQAGGSLSVAGFFQGHVIVDGDLFVSGSKGGYLVDIALNDGAETLEQGDVVIVVGVSDPISGEIPVPRVRKSDAEASTAVIGVVERAQVIVEEGPALLVANDGAIAPGEYLSIVTMGSFSHIKADASYGAIEPGDLLVSSPTLGHAMRADAPAVGTVVGKAMSSLESGTGAVAVMVTLQ